MAKSGTATKWRDLVHLEARYRRSVHLERDFTSPEALAGYVITPLVRATLGRVGEGLVGSGGRAWSFTGPYGSGKSAFAVYLANVFHHSDEHGKSARRMLELVDPELHRRLFAGDGASYLVPVLATGERKSLEAILLRALADAASRYWSSTKKPRLVAQLEKAAAVADRGERTGAKDVVHFVEQFADKVGESKQRGRGVLILIDEAGKALEFAAHHPDRADVQLLQELAEAASRSGDRPVVVGVLLHQAFDQYASRLGTAQRNEWAKIQGRYEDVPFQEAADQILRLIAMALRLRPLSEAASKAMKAVIGDIVDAVSPPGIPDKGQLTHLLSQTLPLHPVTALLLGPIFRSQISQNERSLFAFLSSAEPGAFQDFLEMPINGKEGLETYRPDRLFNYLSSALGERLYRQGGRHWAQVDAGLARLPKDASELDARVVKTVGLLGLLGEGAGVPATERLLQLALADESDAARTRVTKALERLRGASILVYRRFRNSYQLWDGSDLDLDERIRAAVAQIDPRVQLLRLLERAVPPRPMVARRHLFQTGTLRYFEVRYGDETVIDGEWAAQETEADGVIWVLVPSDEALSHDLKTRLNRPSTWLGHGGTSKPVVVGVMNEAGRLREAAVELAALEWVRAHTAELGSDPVARKELAGRILDAENVLRREMSGLVTGERDAAWFYRGRALPARNGRDLGAHLSIIFDEVFDKAPLILNELLNRGQLSSAAAAARRELLLAMVEKRSEANLGMEGFPPERSMYRSVLEAHGLHGQVDGKWQLKEPKQGRPGSLLPAIREVQRALGKDGARLPMRRVYDLLKRPPYGLKEGLIPVLVVWLLLIREAEIALYEEGAFVPAVNGPVIERLLRAPDKFEVQRFVIAEAREALFGELTGREDSAEQGPLPLVRQFVKAVQELPDFTRTTRDLSSTAVQVRDAIARAKEPGTLIFHDLPVACGFEPVKGNRHATLPDGLVPELTKALKELRSAYPRLLDKVREQLTRAFILPASPEQMRRELTARAKRLLPVASDTQLRTFLVRAGDDTLDLHGWTVSVATFLGGKPPESWNDADLQKLSVNLVMVARRFVALEAAFMEHQQAGLPEGSVAVRVSVTEAGKNEAERVVIVRKDERQQADAVGRRLLEAVQAECGDASRETVVAGLAEVIRQLLVEMDDQAAAVEGDGE